MKKTTKALALVATGAVVVAATPLSVQAGPPSTYINNLNSQILTDEYETDSGDYDIYSLTIDYHENGKDETLRTTHYPNGFISRLTVEDAEEFVDFGTDKTLDGVTLETSITTDSDAEEQTATYTITNNGTDTKTVTIASGADVELGWNFESAASLFWNDNTQKHEYIIVQDDPEEAGFSVQYRIHFNYDPTTTWLGDYRDLEDSLTENTALPNEGIIYSAVTEDVQDSALAFSWVADLAPGQSRTFQVIHNADTNPIDTVDYYNNTGTWLIDQEIIQDGAFTPLAYTTAPAGQHSYWKSGDSESMYPGFKYVAQYNALKEYHEDNELVELENEGNIDIGVGISSDLESDIADFLETGNSNLYYQPDADFYDWDDDEEDDDLRETLGLSSDAVFLGKLYYTQNLYYITPKDETTYAAKKVYFDLSDYDITTSVVLPGDIDATNLLAFTYYWDENDKIVYTPVAIIYDYDTHELVVDGYEGNLILVDCTPDAPNTGYKFLGN